MRLSLGLQGENSPQSEIPMSSVSFHLRGRWVSDSPGQDLPIHRHNSSRDVTHRPSTSLYSRPPLLQRPLPLCLQTCSSVSHFGNLPSLTFSTGANNLSPSCLSKLLKRTLHSLFHLPGFPLIPRTGFHFSVLSRSTLEKVANSLLKTHEVDLVISSSMGLPAAFDTMILSRVPESLFTIVMPSFCSPCSLTLPSLSNSSSCGFPCTFKYRCPVGLSPRLLTILSLYPLLNDLIYSYGSVASYTLMIKCIYPAFVVPSLRIIRHQNPITTWMSHR